MRISVFLAFLLSWSFVSSNPHDKKLNDNVDELKPANNRGSDSLTLTTTNSLDDASSGKDWGGRFSNSLSQEGRANVDKKNRANDKLFLLTLIKNGLKMGKEFIHVKVEEIKKLFETLILKHKLPDIPLIGNGLLHNNNNDDIITRIRKTIEMLFSNHHERTRSVSEMKKSTSVDAHEKTGKHNRVKRDLTTSSSGLLWGDPYIGGISQHLLKLSEGSVGNVLKSEKATVAEALNGRAAIRRILERAKAKEAAKAAQHKMLYENNDFVKWLLSGLAFNMDIFKRPFRRPSFDAKISEDSKTESTDDSRLRVFSESHRASVKPANYRHRDIKRTFNALSDNAAIGTADTGNSRTKLPHKSKHREHLSSKLQITSGEERDYETNGMFRKPALSRHTHRWLSYDDAENIESRHAPHTYFHATENEKTGDDGTPDWEHAKWMYRNSFRLPSFHSEEYVFDTSEEREEFEKRYIFKTTFDGLEREFETDNEAARAGHRENKKISRKIDIYDKIQHYDPDDERKIMTFDRRGKNEMNKLARKRYYYDIGDREYSVHGDAGAITFDNTKNRHLADFLVRPTSLIDSRQRGNVGKRNDRRNDSDGVQRSAIYSATSTERANDIKKKQSRDVLIKKISAATPARKVVSIDIGNYRAGDQSANTATSFLPGLSDGKGSKRTNNVLAPLSVDDGSVAVKSKVGDGRGLRLGGARAVINNDATSAEIEVGFSGIKSHLPADLPSARSPHTPSRARSKTHLGNQKAHRSGHRQSTADTAASSKTKHSMDGNEEKGLETRVKTHKSLPVKEYENYDSEENQRAAANAKSSAGTATSIKSRRRYDLSRTLSDDLREEGYIKNDKKYMGLRGIARRPKTSIEVIDIDDRDADEAQLSITEFPVYKFGKGRALHDVNYYDSDNREARGDPKIDVDESAEDLRKNKIVYDDLEGETKSASGDDTPKKLVMTVASERGFHDRHSQHKSGKHGRREHHSKHSLRSQHNRHAFNQHIRNSLSSSASNATEIWNKYLYYIRQKGNDASFETLASTREKNKKRNNAMDEEVLLSKRRGRKYRTDEGERIYLKKHKKWPARRKKLIIKKIPGYSVQNMRSIEINKVRSAEDYKEGEIKSESKINNRSKNRKIVTHNLIYDSSQADSKKAINNNNKGLWKWVSLENRRAGPQTKAKHVYDRNDENVDIGIKQTVAMESIDRENNFRHTSTKTSSTSRAYAKSQSDSENHTSESNKSEETRLTTKIEASNEKVFSNDVKNGHQHGEDLRKTSASSKSIDKSQIETKRRAEEKSKSSHVIEATTKTSTEIALSSSNAVDKSRSNVENINSKLSASSKSSASSSSSKLFTELQIGSEHNLNSIKGNEKYKTNAEASANASVKNRQEVLENKSSFSKLSAKSEGRIEISNNLKNIQNSTINIKDSSTASSKSAIESEVNTGQKSNEFKNTEINADAGTKIFSGNVKNELSTSSSSKSSEESQIKSQIKTNNYLTNSKNYETNAMSETSVVNTVKDEHQSQESFSASSSTENLQASSEHRLQSESTSSESRAKPKIKNEYLNIRSKKKHINTETSSKTTSSIHMKDGHQSRSQNTYSFSKSSAESQAESDHSSNEIRADHEQDITSKTEAASSIFRNNHQRGSISSSTSSSFAKSQMGDKNSEISTSTVLSSNNFVNDEDQRNLPRISLSSQTAGKNDLNAKKDDPRITDDNTVTTSANINDNNREHEETLLRVKWLIDPANKDDTKQVTNNKDIEKSEVLKKDSEDASNAVALTKAVTSDLENTQNLITVLSSNDSKTKTRLHGEHDLNEQKEGKITVDNSVISKISASRKLNEIKNNRKNGMLKTSSYGSHSVSEKKKGHKIGIMQDSQESMATVKASSESMISSSNKQSKSDLLKETASSEASEKVEKQQSNFERSKEKSEATMSETRIEATSNNAYNAYRDNKQKGASSVISSEEIRTDNKLKDKTRVNVDKTIKNLKSKIIQNNNHKRENSLKLESSHDSSDEGYIESAINSKSKKNVQDENNTNKMTSMKLGSSESFNSENINNELISIKSASSNSFNRKNQNDLVKIIARNLQAEISQKDRCKSDTLSDITKTSSIKSAFYDEKQELESDLQKVIFLSDPHDEVRIKQEGNYGVAKELVADSGSKESEANNLLREIIPSELQTGIKNIKKISKHGMKNTADVLESKKIINANFKGGRHNDDPFRMSIENFQDKYRHQLPSLVDTKALPKSDYKSSILKQNKIINSETRDDINEWYDKFQSTTSSLLHAGLQNKKETVVRTEMSAGSTVDDINEDVREVNSKQEKSLFASSNIVQVGKEHNYDENRRVNCGDTARAKISAKISNANISPIERQDYIKEEASVASQPKRHDFTFKKEGKAITSNVPLPTKEADFSEMQNLRQSLLETTTSSNSRTEVQRENLSNILKESSQVTSSAVASAQTTSSGKVESESRAKLIKDLSESNLYAKSQTKSKNDLSISRKGRIIENAKTSTDSVSFNGLEDAPQIDPIKDNSLFDPGHDIYVKNENRNVWRNNFVADTIASAKVTNRNILKDEHQEDMLTASLSNSRANAQTKHEYNSNVQRESIQTTSSNDMKDQVSENKNIVNGMEATSQIAANIVASAQVTSSSGIENVSKQDSARASSLFESSEFTESQMNNALNVTRNGQEATNTQTSTTSTSASADNEVKREDDIVSGISRATLQDRKTRKMKNNDNVSRENSQNNESMDRSHKNNFQKLTSSSNSFAKSKVGNISVQKEDRIDILSASTQTTSSSVSKGMKRDKSLQMTSSGSYAEIQAKDGSIDGIKKDPSVINARIKMVSSTDIKGTDSHGSLNDAMEMKTKNKKISRKGIIKTGLSDISSNLFSETKIESAHDSKISKDNRDNSAIVDAMAKMESSNEQKDFHKLIFSSHIQDSQRDLIKSTSSSESYIAGEKAKEDRGVSIVNISTLGKASGYNEVKGADDERSDWLATTSGADILAQERAQNRDKFNVLREVEEVAVYAGTSGKAAASNNIDGGQHDIRAEDPRGCQDSSNVAKKLEDVPAISSASAEKAATSKGTQNKSESILNNKMTSSSSGEARIETWIKNRGESGVSHSSDSSANNEETRDSTASSAISSVSTSDSASTDSMKYDRINNGNSATSVITPMSKEIRLPSVGTFSRLSHKMDKCDENVQTREFINEATSLYKMLNKQRNSEIILMKKNPEGPIQVASFRRSLPPLIAYRLVPREVYERTRATIANEQILCTDCPLSSM